MVHSDPPLSLSLCLFTCTTVHKCILLGNKVKILPIGLKFSLTSTQTPQGTSVISLTCVLPDISPHLEQGFSTWHYWHLGPMILCSGGHPVLYRMFSSNRGLHPLGASNSSCPVVTTKTISRHCHMFPQGKIAPPCGPKKFFAQFPMSVEVRCGEWFAHLQAML